MGEKYLIGTWQGFIQQIQYLVSRGYTNYCLIHYPQEKAEKFVKIDKKLIKKYNANLGKDKAYYNKKKKFCNFKFLRYEHTAILLQTSGNLPEKIIKDDVFLDVKNEKICIVVGGNLTVKIGYGEKETITISLDSDSYRDVKVTCFEYADLKQYGHAIDTFNQLNALPAWGGIVAQKIKMKEQLLRKLNEQLPHKTVQTLAKKMVINTKRTPVKVFE